jgi:hypothetical protein
VILNLFLFSYDIYQAGIRVKNKKAVITIQLVEESADKSNEALEKEIFESLSKELPRIPWLAEVKKVRVMEG